MNVPFRGTNFKKTGVKNLGAMLRSIMKMTHLTGIAPKILNFSPSFLEICTPERNSHAQCLFNLCTVDVVHHLALEPNRLMKTVILLH